MSKEWIYDPNFEYDAPQFCDFSTWQGKNLDMWFGMLYSKCEKFH